jgi:phosphoglycolate phosphatase
MIYVSACNNSTNGILRETKQSDEIEILSNHSLHTDADKAAPVSATLNDTRYRTVMNVLLDLDGTLTDPREGILACLRHALCSIGLHPPEDRELERFIGPPLQDSLASLLGPKNKDQVNDAIAFYRERFSTKGMFENAVYPGIREALVQLRDRGATLYVATSKPNIFAGRIIEYFGLGGFFRSIYGSELDGTRSNKIELIAHVLKAESLPREATVMVGDRAHDVAGARANGVRPIGALWGYGSREELTAAGAQVLCKQPSMLVEAVLFNTGVQPTLGEDTK